MFSSSYLFWLFVYLIICIFVLQVIIVIFFYIPECSGVFRMFHVPGFIAKRHFMC